MKTCGTQKHRNSAETQTYFVHVVCYFKRSGLYCLLTAKLLILKETIISLSITFNNMSRTKEDLTPQKVSYSRLGKRKSELKPLYGQPQQQAPPSWVSSFALLSELCFSEKHKRDMILTMLSICVCVPTFIHLHKCHDNRELLIFLYHNAKSCFFCFLHKSMKCETAP